jgi:NodT family efflux transporter outer membrane factor (OMF) lipoprotein
MKLRFLSRRGVLAAAGATAIAAGLTGCAVGPDYKRPAALVPDTWKETPGETVTPETSGQWKAAVPRDAAQRTKWWEVFGDLRLNELEEQVAISNLNIAQSEAQLRSSRAAIRVAKSDFYPAVTANAGVTRAEGARSVSGTNTAPGTTYTVGGAVNWEVDVFGRIRRNVEASVAGAQATAADLESVRLAFQAELATDYFALRGVDAEKRLLDTNVVAYQRALDLTVNRHNQGVVSGVDVAQAETQLYNTQAQSTELSLTRAQLEHAIAILIGRPPQGFSIPLAPLDLEPPGVPLSLPSELLERRPEVAAAERRVASANAQVGVATAAFFPQLLLAASGGYGSSTLSQLFNLPNRFWSIGPSLVATLFQGGRRRALKEEAVAQYDFSVATYRLSVLTAFQQVEDDLAAIRILGEEAKQQADATAAAERAATLARNRYEGGITTYLEVVTAEAVALNAGRSSIELLTRRMTSTVDLIRALGGGWRVEDLDATDPGPVGGRPLPETASR